MPTIKGHTIRFLPKKATSTDGRIHIVAEIVGFDYPDRLAIARISAQDQTSVVAKLVDRHPGQATQKLEFFEELEPRSSPDALQDFADRYIEQPTQEF